MGMRRLFSRAAGQWLLIDRARLVCLPEPPGTPFEDVSLTPVLKTGAQRNEFVAKSKGLGSAEGSTRRFGWPWKASCVIMTRMAERRKHSPSSRLDRGALVY